MDMATGMSHGPIECIDASSNRAPGASVEGRNDMRIGTVKPLHWVALALFSSTAVLPSVSEACTRTLYPGTENTVITGRSMDWMQDMQTDLWAFPAGMARDGAAGPDSPKWVSRYGSVVASAYNIASADGMNEKGLVANMLYLAEAEYGGLDDKPPMSIGLWAQYVLDNYATVAEAVEGLQAQPFRIIAPKLPNGSAATLHLSISDPSGDSAIFEYLDGELVVHHGKQFTVMTNSPSYDQQLALNSYWKKIGGLKFLPGTNSAADRFARASFLLGAIPLKSDPNFISAVPDGSYANHAQFSSLTVGRWRRLSRLPVPLRCVTTVPSGSTTGAPSMVTDSTPSGGRSRAARIRFSVAADTLPDCIL